MFENQNLKVVERIGQKETERSAKMNMNMNFNENSNENFNENFDCSSFNANAQVNDHGASTPIQKAPAQLQNTTSHNFVSSIRQGSIISTINTATCNNTINGSQFSHLTNVQILNLMNRRESLQKQQEHLQQNDSKLNESINIDDLLAEAFPPSKPPSSILRKEELDKEKENAKKNQIISQQTTHIKRKSKNRKTKKVKINKKLSCIVDSQYPSAINKTEHGLLVVPALKNKKSIDFDDSEMLQDILLQYGRSKRRH